MLLGKTCTPEFGCKGKGETNSPLTGISRSPWDARKTPGGSSGGTAGSVRIPAAFCGNFGLKPSFGRVQPLHELQRAHDQVRRSVAPRRLELELHLPRRIDLYALVR